MSTEKSLKMQDRAKQRIPGMTQLLSKRPDMFAPGVWPGYYQKAEGVEVWDLDGNRYIDMSIGGIGANVLGYADPDVDAAVIGAIKRGSSSSLNCSEEVELADLLCDLHPWAEMVRYSRTGGESMAIAIRISRAYTERDKITFCGYHGWHDWYLAANLQTENALGEHLISGLNPRGVPNGLAGTALPFRYNHLEELEAIIADHRDQLAAIVMEPIRSDIPKPGFLEGIRRIADKYGIVLVFDEVSSGFRLTSGGAHLKYGVVPDIAVFSKALGNGYPIGAIIGKQMVMEAAQSTFISSTNWTERVGPAAALACLKKHRERNVADHLVMTGERIQNGWREASEKYDLKIDISGISPLSHFNFCYDNALELKALFVQQMLDKGFLASNLFYAMYAHTEAHVKQYLAAVDSVFSDIAGNLEADNIKPMLIGEPASSGFKRLT